MQQAAFTVGPKPAALLGGGVELQRQFLHAHHTSGSELWVVSQIRTHSSCTGQLLATCCSGVATSDMRAELGATVMVTDHAAFM